MYKWKKKKTSQTPTFDAESYEPGTLHDIKQRLRQFVLHLASDIQWWRLEVEHKKKCLGFEEKKGLIKHFALGLQLLVLKVCRLSIKKNCLSLSCSFRVPSLKAWRLLNIRLFWIQPPIFDIESWRPRVQESTLVLKKKEKRPRQKKLHSTYNFWQ